MFITILLVMSLSHLLLGSDVKEYTDENFSAEIQKHDIVLVEFFAPWCGHCKKLAPEYEAAATELKSESIPLAKVDCTELGVDVCQEQRIEGYPALKIFRNGEFSADYDGPRDTAGIVSYMKKQAAPSSTHISSEDKLAEFIDDTEPSIVGFFKQDGSDSELKESFVACAEKMRTDFRFAHTFESPSSLGQTDLLPEKVEGEQIWLYQPLRLRSKFESPAFLIPEGSTNEIEAFIILNFMGVVGIREISKIDYFDIPARDPRLVFYSKLDWGLNPKIIRYWRNRLLKLAKDFDYKMSFAMSDSEAFERELSERFGIIQTNKMQAVIVSNSRKYVMAQEGDFKMTIDEIRNFVQSFLDGELKAYLKSEMKPVDNDEPVKIVVGTTFDEIVMDPTKDVLIEFYAPWCGHCKSLAPKLDELAETLEDNHDVVIAKLDATANDFPAPFEVEGFPTLYWVPINNKDQPAKYTGGREVSDFLDYIKKEATNPIVLKEKKKKDKTEL